MTTLGNPFDTMKSFVPTAKCSHLNILTIFPAPEGGCSEGLDAYIFFLMSIHTPRRRGENMSKRLGGKIGCKYKNSSLDSNEFPYVIIVLIAYGRVNNMPTSYQ